ncbi:MAG: PhzF family phenazine biosynthesis protein [Kiloniellales bacterium]
MSQEIPLYQVDAFAARAFGGNPAAVCPLDDWLPDEVMQAIAAENNLSETAFLVRRGRDYDLRWFTPAIEVDLCGHATLASAHVVATHLEPGREEMAFMTRSGQLTVRREGELFVMDFPAQPPSRLGESEAASVAAALGAAPLEVWRAGKTMAVLDNQAAVLAAEPDLDRVAALEGDGLIVTAPGEGCDFVSRYFAPHAGIPEDPVTGSAHCVLTPYWAERLGKQRLSARQVSRRGGELTLELRGERVLIAGRVAPYLEGRIRV